MELFKLFGTIALDNTEANKGMDETTGKAKDSESKISSSFKKIGSAVVTYFAVDTIVNFGSACLDAASDAQAMESQFTQVFGELEDQAASNLSSIADAAGITETRMKGSYTKIAAFAKTTGMETADALSIADRAMVAVADSAAFYDRTLEETTESLQSFLKGNFENDAALGISATETTRNAAANELYGKSFKDLSESQKQLTLLKMVEDGNKLSGAMGQAARESETWTNQTGNLKQAWTDFKAVIGGYFLEEAVGGVTMATSAVTRLKDVVGDLLEFWGEIIAPATSSVRTAFGGILKALDPIRQAFVNLLPESVQTASAMDFIREACYLLEGILIALAERLDAVSAWIVENTPQIIEIINGLWEGILFVWETIGQPIFNMLQTAFNTLFTTVQAYMPQIREFVSQCFTDIQAFWNNNLKPCLEAISAFIQNVLAPAFEFVFREAIWSVVETVFGSIKDLWNNTLKPVFTGITDFLTGVFTGNWKKAFEGLDKIVVGIFNGLVNRVKTPINLVISVVNGFIKGLNRLKIPDWVPGVGGKGINIPLIPRLEKGGILEKGQIGLLEGNGAEAVVPLDQNKAWIRAVAADMKSAGIGSNSNVLTEYFQQMLEMLAYYLPQILEASGHDIVTNDGVIVARYAPLINRELGKISTRKDRGR